MLMLRSYCNQLSSLVNNLFFYSSKGEVSAGNNNNGGFFTFQFRESLKQMLVAGLSPSQIQFSSQLHPGPGL